MTIDEVIVSLRKSASKSLDYEWQREQYQLAEWLEELKDYQDKNKMVVRVDCINSEEFKGMAVKLAKEQYNKAIDDFAELLKGNLIRKYANANLTQQYVALQVTDWCNEIAEQLKAGEHNG